MQVSLKHYLLLVFFGTVLMIGPPTDPDFGWHFKYGEYYWQNHRLLTNDIHSYTKTGYRWLDSYWLFSTILYPSHAWLGSFWASAILSCVLAVFLLEVLKRVSQTEFGLSVGYFILILGLAGFNITVRPQFYSVIFMLLLLYVLLYKNIYIKWLPLLFLVWANFHAEFTIGLFVFGTYCFAEILSKRKLTASTGLLVLSALATLINPYGVELILTIIKDLPSPAKAAVVEWAPPNFLATDFAVTYVMVIFFCLAGSWHISKTQSLGIRRWYTLLVWFFFLFSLKSVYMHRVTYVIGIFGIVLMFDEIYRKYLVRWVAKRETFFAYFYVTVLCLVMLGYKFTQVKDFLNGAAAYGYPTTAVTYLKNTLDSRDGRNIFNWYGWGGYLIWQLPEYKTFIDGRMAVWNTDGKYIMDDYRSMTISPEKNADLVKYYFDRYNIGYVLEHKNSNLIKHLLYGSENGRWAVVNEGPTHTLIRKSAD